MKHIYKITFKNTASSTTYTDKFKFQEAAIDLIESNIEFTWEYVKVTTLDYSLNN